MSQADGITIEQKVYEQDAAVTLITISGYVDQANCHVMQEAIDSFMGPVCVDRKGVFTGYRTIQACPAWVYCVLGQTLC